MASLLCICGVEYQKDREPVAQKLRSTTNKLTMSKTFSFGKILLDLADDCDTLSPKHDRAVAKQEVQKIQFDYLSALIKGEYLDIDGFHEKVAIIKQRFQI